MDTVYECDRRTDRQTDRITITKTVQRIASHGKNVIIPLWRLNIAVEYAAIGFCCKTHRPIHFLPSLNEIFSVDHAAFSSLSIVHCLLTFLVNLKQFSSICIYMNTNSLRTVVTHIWLNWVDWLHCLELAHNASVRLHYYVQARDSRTDLNEDRLAARVTDICKQFSSRDS